MARRLKAKPEALAARGKLADGTHPGMARSPVAEFDASDVASIDVRLAEGDRAIELLRKLERCLSREAGYMRPEDQDSMRAARALLVEIEVRGNR